MIPNRSRKRRVISRRLAGTPEDFRTPLQLLTYRTLVRTLTRLGIARQMNPRHVAAIAAEFADIAERLPYPMEDFAYPKNRAPGDLRLTPGERRALIGVARGMTRVEIGAYCNRHEQTIKSQLKNVYHALGARNAPHAVMIALRTGILTFADFEDAREDASCV